MDIRTWILGLLGVCLVFALFPPTARSQEGLGTTVPEFPRLRTSNGALTALIDEAMKGSPTFAKLVGSLETTDGVVFVEEGRCQHGVPACLTWRVTLAGPYRLLFVLIDIRRPGDDVVASVGHELQHALEVLSEASVRSPEAIHMLYLRGMSPESPRAMETTAAEAAGRAVFREFRRYRSRAQK